MNPLIFRWPHKRQQTPGFRAAEPRSVRPEAGSGALASWVCDKLDAYFFMAYWLYAGWRDRPERSKSHRHEHSDSCYRGRRFFDDDLVPRRTFVGRCCVGTIGIFNLAPSQYAFFPIRTVASNRSAQIGTRAPAAIPTWTATAAAIIETMVVCDFVPAPLTFFLRSAYRWSSVQSKILNSRFIRRQ